MTQTLKIPVLILGGGTGGVAAAMALARENVRCIVVEPSRWIGGQLTSQAVPPDENRWIEGIDGVVSATQRYLRFRASVRAYYKTHRQLAPHAQNDPQLNPGGGWVSRLCFEPAIGQHILAESLKPPVANGIVQLLTRSRPASANVNHDSVHSVTIRNLDTGDETDIEPTLILDATETGDLYPLADIEHHIGAEHRDVFGELHGREDKTDPMDQQAATWCFAMEHQPDENHVIDKPKDYDFWRSYAPPIEPGWPGPLFSWTIGGHNHEEARDLAMVPWPDEPTAGQWELWRYRRIVNRNLYADPQSTPPDVSLFNCVQMDYFQKPLLGVSDEQRDAATNEARQQSLCFFYWMQTDAPRHDGNGQGYPGLKLRGDELGTTDGFAIAPYIREPRRLNAKTMLTEAHVGQDQRLAQGAKPIEGSVKVTGEAFTDSIGIGHYPIDLHPSAAMRNSVYVPAAPFRIPLGALLPVRITNVIAAGKALGVSHVANGSTRLHPVEWAIGEAAGVLAAMCIQHNLKPAVIHDSAQQVCSLQQHLTNHGIPLKWPWEEA